MRKARTLGLGEHFTAFNMSSGYFGKRTSHDNFNSGRKSSRGDENGRDHEMIVVQSLDGKLEIFDPVSSEDAAFSRKLTDCLIPGPILFDPKVGAFVTVNHACQTQCYQYNVLANAQSDVGSKESDSKISNKNGDSGLWSKRSAMVHWTTDIGEPCRQILQGNFSMVNNSSDQDIGNKNATNGYDSNSSELLMLCDKSLYLLKGFTGGVIQQRRLERADASCMCVVANGRRGGGDNFMLVGQDATLQVYSGFNLGKGTKAFVLIYMIDIAFLLIFIYFLYIYAMLNIYFSIM